jgi:hypothetical protein
MTEQLAIDGAIAELIRPMRAALAGQRHFTEEGEACTKEFLAFLFGRAGNARRRATLPVRVPAGLRQPVEDHRGAHHLRQQLYALRRPRQDERRSRT